MKYSVADKIIFKKKFKKNIVKRYLDNLYVSARFINDSNILNLLEKNPKAQVIDLGCDDGNFSKFIADKVGTKNISGLDIVENRLSLAKKVGIKTIKGDLNKKFSIKNNSFDVVHANQVIEHVTDLDNFISEIQRILKPGGYAIISTENASSWCNIFASIMGWQIFSLTNFSKKSWGLGNPLAIHSGESTELSSWTHKTILNIMGLKSFFEVYDFKVEEIKGAGYFPLPGSLGKIDKIHAHFMTFKVRKNKRPKSSSL